MTSIKLIIADGKARAEVNGALTSGMTGIPVTIQYDQGWNGLKKNLVCRSSRFGPENGDTRTILDIGKTATVAHEVMKEGYTLYLGVEGRNADGSLVLPTTWAKCGIIQPGANGGADPSAKPTAPLWAQLQASLAAMGEQCLTKEQLNTAVEEYLKAHPIEVPESSGGCFLTVETITVEDTIPVTGISLDYPSLSLTAGDTAQLTATVSPANATNPAVLWATSDASVASVADGLVTAIAGGNATITARAAENSSIITSCVVTVTAEESGDSEEVTLTGISAAYSGGDVAAGTAVTDLTGIVVTAAYSDGTTQTVMDYTLSGTIAAGSNTITVSYGGMTTTFTVTGVAESTGEKIQFSTLTRTSGGIKSDGTAHTLAGTYYVTIPYTEGMYIRTMYGSWSVSTYPAILVMTDGTYSLPAYNNNVADEDGNTQENIGGKVGIHVDATLTGYPAGSSVIVNMLLGTATETQMDARDWLYYIPGGES